MSHAIDRMREELIKARILCHIARRHSVYDMADTAEAEPEKYLPDVPVHQRGFGIMDEDVP